MRSDQQTDDQRTERLLNAIREGDQQALNDLIDVHRDYLRRVISLRLDQALQGRVDPSDVIQETALVAVGRIEDFLKRRPTTFKLWLRGEALQQLGAQRRRHVEAACRSVEREHDVANASSLMITQHLLQCPPCQLAEQKELAFRVRQVIEGLSVLDREIVTLRYVEGLSNAEAAEVLAVDQATARKRHGRALKRLVAALVKEGLSDPRAPDTQ